MDTTSLPRSSRSGPWTNEKHIHFLNSMEASFVRTMFENKGHHLRLDRYLPDISDSTLDLKTHRREKQPVTSDNVDIARRTPRAGLDSRRDRSRRQSYQPHTSSQDQVVPQLGNIRDDKDESNPSNVPVAPAN